MNIPEYIQTYDVQTHITSTYKYVKKVNDRLLLYENIKTGCKQCFDLRDMTKRESKTIKKLPKYEWDKTIYKQDGEEIV